MSATHQPFLSYADRVKAKIDELIDPDTVSDIDLAGMVAHYLISIAPFNNTLAAFAIDHDVKVERGPKTGACPLPYQERADGEVRAYFKHPEAAKPWIVRALCFGYRVSRGDVSLGTLEDIRKRQRYRKQREKALPEAADDEIPF